MHEEPPRLSTRWLVRLAILALLARNGPMHGYAIYKRLLEMFSRVKLISMSLVYTVLSELEKEGLIEAKGFEPDAPSGGRKLLAPTERGLVYLAEHGSGAWRLLADIAALIAEGEAQARLELGDYGGLLNIAGDAARTASRFRDIASKLLPAREGSEEVR